MSANTYIFSYDTVVFSPSVFVLPLFSEESFVEDDDYDMPKIYSKDMCSELSKHLMHEKDLPKECAKFRDIVGDLKRRETDTSHPTQWMS